MARVDPLLLQGYSVTGGLFAICPQKVKVCPGEAADSEKVKTEGALAWNWFKINHGIICYSHTHLTADHSKLSPPHGFVVPPCCHRSLNFLISISRPMILILKTSGMSEGKFREWGLVLTSRRNR